MRISVDRLRIGLLVGAGLLVLVIASFLGYARYRLHRGLANLPRRLGATITSESNGITWSQSDGKQTVFTIHAAKSVQHNDGKYTLHDVNIILYGHKGDRADRISGSEFEYDTKAEVIQAVGVVHIDLQAPVAQGMNESEASKHLNATGLPAGMGEAAGAGSRVIHVTTSGLKFVKAQATAATSQPLEFAFGGFTGHAVGAEYNSQSGHLVLQSAVMVSGINKGRPIALAASHGELERASDSEATRADFSQARYSSSGEVAEAEMAHLSLRADGSVETIDGVGRVVLRNAGQGRATSDRAQVALDPLSKPKSAVLTGNVHFNKDEAFRQANGGSERADISFDEQGRIDHAVLRGGVHTCERARAVDDPRAPWSERTLAADALSMNFAAADGTAGKAELRDAKATGSARLSSVTTVLENTAAKQASFAGTATKKAGTTTTKLAADEVQAHFVTAHGAAELSTLHGAGHTVLQQSAPGAIEQSSRSETLDLRFREVIKEKPSVEIAEAVQQGGVMIDRTAPAKSRTAGAAPGPGRDIQHRVAGRAVYDADLNKVTLTDAVEITDTTSDTGSDAHSTILAAKVVMDLDSGDATADGAVKATYLQARSTEPVHVLAARAELDHDAARAVFYGRAAGDAGSGSGLARMWQASPAARPQSVTAGAKSAGSSEPSSPAGAQGGSQIEAPVLVFDQDSNRLTARAERPGVSGTVHTLLMSASTTAGSGPAGRRADSRSNAKPTAKSANTGAKGPREQPSPVRITSSEMVYSDEQRQAVFTGGVRVVESSGEMRAQEATVFLTPANSRTEQTSGTTSKVPAADTGLMAGQVDRIVATRHIQLTQPGRVATGDRLVYTAADQMFVLTGTAAAPPKVVDDEQGMTTGAMLRFHSGDQNVSILGSDGVAPARRVHTETHIGAGVYRP